MSYEVKTQLLLESVAAARVVINGVQDGSIEMATATRILSGARVLQSAVAHDIRVRLAEPKIRAMEAKLVEAQQQQRLAAE